MNRIGRREAANGAGIGEFDSIAFLPSFHLRRRTDRHASSFSETGFDGGVPSVPGRMRNIRAGALAYR